MGVFSSRECEAGKRMTCVKSDYEKDWRMKDGLKERKEADGRKKRVVVAVKNNRDGD